MKQHTNGFKNNVKEMGRQISSILSYDQTVLQQELYSATMWYEGNILKSVMKTLEIESSVDIPLEKVVNFQFGVLVDGDYEFLDYGNYVVVSSEKQEDTNTYKITCKDKIVYSMKPYENIGVVYPITVRDYMSAICNHLGIGFGSIASAFANWNKVIPNEKYLDASGNDLGYTFRDVLDELAEVTGSTICINENDELEVRYITPTNDTIDKKFLKDVNVTFGQKYGPINSIVLSRSGNADNVYLQNEQSIENNGLCELRISDNQIMNDNNRSEYLPDLLARLGGLEYYINDYSSTGICYYDVCDRYNVQVDEQSYSCVMFNDEIDITQGIEESIYTKMPEQSKTDYEKSDKTDQKINQTYFIVDKQNQAIESVITNVTEQNNKISQITQTVDELSSKISDLADITIAGETSYATLNLDGINESEPIEIRVRPVSENISYWYPNTGLFPDLSLFLKTRTIRFTNTDTNEVVEYELPDDLLFYDSEHYDEFYLNYESQTCQVTKRCKYNADGTVSLLDNEIVTSYPYPTLLLTDGDYTIELLGYNYGYLSVRLMSSNIYTTQFVTKIEMNSAIDQKANEISLVVNEKMDEEDFTHASIVAKINDDTSQVQIEADKVDLKANDVINILAGNTLNLTSNTIAIDSTNFKVTKDGVLTAKSGTIGGFNIGASSLYNNKSSLTASSNGVYVGTDGISLGSGNTFKVTNTGQLTATNANINGSITSNNVTVTGGKIHLAGGSSSNPNFIVGDLDVGCWIIPRQIWLSNGTNERFVVSMSDNGGMSAMWFSYANHVKIEFNLLSSNGYATFSVPNVYVEGTMHANAYHYDSKAEIKDNIKEYKNNAIDIIQNTKVYNFTYKKDRKKQKTIGFVIGKDYEISDEIVNDSRDGINSYSVLGVLWKAIQEQQKQIDELKSEIEKLKGEK